MKKITFIILAMLCVLLSLGACSKGEASEEANKAEDVATQDKESNTSNQDEFISKEVNLGEAINIKRKEPISIGDYEIQKYNLTVNYKLTQNKSSNEEYNAEFDYIQLDILLENTGDVTVSEDAVKDVSFTVYDQEGVEIKQPITHMFSYNDETFKAADVRPGGKNKGILYLAIPKGKVPATMIYTSDFMADEDEYIFNLNK